MPAEYVHILRVSSFIQADSGKQRVKLIFCRIHNKVAVKRNHFFRASDGKPNDALLPFCNAVRRSYSPACLPLPARRVVPSKIRVPGSRNSMLLSRIYIIYNAFACKDKKVIMFHSPLGECHIPSHKRKIIAREKYLGNDEPLGMLSVFF